VRERWEHASEVRVSEERKREVCVRGVIPAIIQGDVTLVEEGIEGEEQNARRRPRPVELNH
jgi:hypothetical protein